MTDTAVIETGPRNDASLRAWLAEVTVRGSIRPVVTADAHDTLREVFQRMVANGILSVLVLDKEAQTYLGAVTMLDIVDRVIRTVDRAALQTESWERTAGGGELLNQEVGPLIANEQKYWRDTSAVVSDGISLHAVLQPLGEFKLHRAYLLGDDGPLEIVGVLSQRRVVEWMNERADELSELMSASVADVGVLCDVLCVREDDTAYEAFRTMVDKAHSGLGIVSKEGRLVGAVTVRDIRGVVGADGRYSLGTLFQDVRSFSEASRSRGRKARTLPGGVVTCRPTDTLHGVVRTFADTGVHRIFVADDSAKPVGVISLGDVIRALDRAATSIAGA